MTLQKLPHRRVAHVPNASRHVSSIFRLPTWGHERRFGGKDRQAVWRSDRAFDGERQIAHWVGLCGADRTLVTTRVPRRRVWRAYVRANQLPQRLSGEGPGHSASAASAWHPKAASRKLFPGLAAGARAAGGTGSGDGDRAGLSGRRIHPSGGGAGRVLAQGSLRSLRVVGDSCSLPKTPPCARSSSSRHVHTPPAGGLQSSLITRRGTLEAWEAGQFRA